MTPGPRSVVRPPVGVPGRLVGATALGELYGLTVVRVGPDERAACVRLDVGGDAAAPDGHLALTPDEARALAADLQRWAGHAEREGKRS